MIKLKNDIPQFLGFSFVQSLTDTYVAANIETGIVPSNGFGILPRYIEWEIDFGSVANPGATEFLMHLQITKDEETAILDLNDDGVLVKTGFLVLAGGSSQAVLSQPQPFIWDVPYELPLVEEFIHFGFDTQGVGGTDVVRVNGRIIYDAVELSEIDILRLRQQ